MSKLVVHYSTADGRDSFAKALGRAGDGKPMVLLGLSGENITRIMADEPIHIDLADLGLPPTLVVIVGGRTEGAIREKLVDAGLLAP